MKKQIYILFIVFLFTSCEKDVDLDLKEIPPTPVVEGRISTDSNESYLKISMTKGFKRTSSEYDLVDNAQISVTDNEGNIIPFYFDNTEEKYVTNENALPGKEYHLDIQFDDHHITGGEPVLQPPVILSAIFTTTEDEIGNYDTSLEIEIEDLSNEIDYYYIELIDQADPTDYPYFDTLVSDYEKVDGKFSFEPIYILANQNYKIAVHHIPKNYYEYILLLYDIGSADYGQSPFNTTVMGNPESNISTGIGFFGSSAVTYAVPVYN